MATSNHKLISDLDFAAKLAKDAAHSPLLGGVFFLIWSSLLVPTLLLHGAAKAELFPLTGKGLSLVWLGYGVLGGLLSMLAAKRKREKSGVNSFVNRLSAISGKTLGLLVGVYALAVFTAVVGGILDPEAYNLILPFAFGIEALHLHILGSLSNKKYLSLAALGCGVAMIVTLLLNNHVTMYFLAALAVALCMALPGYIELKEERNENE
ncbi:hypothetical protein [Alteromonas sp. CYL-A6]|uniref:hypothetical protein n=1 Tax=Alteromonas nitratireducens TaxID=3390813 RepID=UPI0034B129F5